MICTNQCNHLIQFLWQCWGSGAQPPVNGTVFAPMPGNWKENYLSLDDSQNAHHNILCFFVVTFQTSCKRKHRLLRLKWKHRNSPGLPAFTPRNMIFVPVCKLENLRAGARMTWVLANSLKLQQTGSTWSTVGQHWMRIVHNMLPIWETSASIAELVWPDIFQGYLPEIKLWKCCWNFCDLHKNRLNDEAKI